MDQLSQVEKNNNPNEMPNISRTPEYQAHGNNFPAVFTRERSFVRSSNQQNKRRSLVFNTQSGGNVPVQFRNKPVAENNRPAKLNCHLQHYPTSTVIFPVPSSIGILTQSKSSVNLHQQMQYMAASNPINNRRHIALSVNNPQSPNIKGNHPTPHSILVSHSHATPISHTSQQIPLIDSPSAGNVFQHSSNTNRVKFVVDTQKMPNGNIGHNYQQTNGLANNSAYNPADKSYNAFSVSPLQRSKSLSSADTFTRGVACLGLALGNEATDIGQFSSEIQALIEKALQNPNQLSSRCLMELTSHFIKRAVEARRFALPISRLCLNIIAKEQKETFLEALLNTCRQWYQEREKLLYSMQGMKSPSRVRFTAFMAFLTEMFCQLKRRQLQLHIKNEGATPPLVLLTMLSKCCEDCVKPPVRSLSEIECLFYVLTCIGQDMEMHLPQQLEVLLTMVRDAFLSANDAAPAIRRTLLQLIELKASHWQLPGNTVLYYYPSPK